MSPGAIAAAVAAAAAAYVAGRVHAARRMRRLRAGLYQSLLDVVGHERSVVVDTVDAYRGAALSAVDEVRAAYDVATRAVAAVGMWRSLADDMGEADAFLAAELAGLRRRAEEGIVQAETLRGWLA